MITHLEPDILECEVKWALDSITMNKDSGGDGIPVELFQILKDDAVKVLHSICLHSICHKFGKLSSDHIQWPIQPVFVLVRAFNPFTFKVIIDKYDPTAIYFIVLGSNLYTLFVSREYPLVFVGELVWWCWILSAFACL